MRKKARKAEDLPCELEYRTSEDDAWYSVSVALDSDAQSLTVKYMCFPVVNDVVFPSDGFETEAQVDELERRFRPLSQQVQDNQCRKLAVGTTVCAAHSTAEDDLRFYDAVIETVNHQAHSLAGGGEEKCLCTFVLFWLHGRGRGTLTSANIENICTLERFSHVDPRISAFLIMAKDKITSSKSVSVLQSFGSGPKGPSSKSDKKSSFIKSIEMDLEQSRNGLLEEETCMRSKRLMWQSTDSSRISNYEQWTSQDDEDLGPQHYNIDGLATRKGQHFILINNLEKDLTPSSIKKFVYKNTTILPQAFVFPTQLSDPFARGAIVVDCPKKVQIVYKFLSNPNQIIVSSRGRPWVINEKTLTGTLRTTIWNLHPMILGQPCESILAYILNTMSCILDKGNLDEVQYKEAAEELEIVHSGTESYDRAHELRDLFIEFMHHGSQVCRKLVLEEKKIQRSFNRLR